MLSLAACEPPESLTSDAIHAAKTELVKAMRVVQKEDVVLGQYAAAGDKPGYQDDEDAPEGTQTATMAHVRLWVDNERWQVRRCEGGAAVRGCVSTCAAHLLSRSLSPSSSSGRAVRHFRGQGAGREED